MQSSVEAISKHERRLTVTVPATEIDQKETELLREIQLNRMIKGFRKGKAPLDLIKKLFGSEVRERICQDKFRETLNTVMLEKNLKPIDKLDIVDFKMPRSGEDLSFTAEFEETPKIKFDNLSKVKIEKPVAQITDADIDETIERMRQMYADWEPTERAAQEGDGIEIDFEGSIAGEPLEQGKAENFNIEIGSKRMISGFEESLIGLKAGDQKTIQATFPEDYHVKHLAGKTADFAIHVHKVLEKKPADLNDEFAERFGVREGGVATLRERIKENLTHQAELITRRHVHEQLADKLYQQFPIDLPEKALKNEIAHAINNEMKGNHDPDHEHGPDCNHDHDHEHHHHELNDQQRSDIEKDVKKRFCLQLLFASYMEQFDIELSEDMLRRVIGESVNDFEHSARLMRYVMQNEQYMNRFRSMALENQIFDHLLTQVTVKEKNYSFNELQKM